MAHRDYLELLENQAKADRLDIQVKLGVLAYKARLDRLDQLESRETEEEPENRVQRDQLGLEADLASLVSQEMMDFQDPQELEEILVNLDQQDLRDPLVIQDLQGLPGQLDHQGKPAAEVKVGRLDLMAIREREDQLDNLVL